jgi:cysteine-rich repeat protein
LGWILAHRRARAARLARILAVVLTTILASACSSRSTDETSSSGKPENVAVAKQALTAPTDYRSLILQSNPIGYWRLGDSQADDAVAHDESPAHIDGMYTGRYTDATAPTAPPTPNQPGALLGDPDSSAYFYISNNYGHSPATQWNWVDIPNNPNQSPARGLSLEAWFTMTPGGVPQTYSSIISKSTSNWSDGYGLYWYAGALYFFINTANINISAPVATIGDTSIFHHVVGVYDYDGQSISIYIDGAKAGGRNISAREGAGQPVYAPGGDLFIGKGRYLGWTGRIDEVAVYDHALQLSEIQSHFQAARPQGPFPRGFVLYAGHSLTLGSSNQVTFGDLGVASAASDDPLQLRVGASDVIDLQRTLYSPSIQLNQQVPVGTVAVNDTGLFANGGSWVSKQSYPASDMPPLPPVSAGTPGTSNVTVGTGKTVQLYPGNYGTLTNNGGTLRLVPGPYSFSSMTLGDNAILYALPYANTTIQVAGTLHTGASVTMAAAAWEIPGDFTISVAGTDPSASVPALTIGSGNNIVALLEAPNGTISIGDNSSLWGAAAARDIATGNGVTLKWQDGIAPVAPQYLSGYVVYANKSITFGTLDLVIGGDVGVASTITGSSAQLVVGAHDNIDTSHVLVAPSVSLGSQAVVGNIETRPPVQNNGGTYAQVTPYPSFMPPVPAADPANPSSVDENIGPNDSELLEPGSFRTVTVYGSLTLAPGSYSFGSITLGDGAHLIVESGGVTELRVSGSISTGTGAQISNGNPTAGSLLFSVSGNDGQNGSPVVSFGDNTQLTGVVIAPNGTISFGNGVHATGTFAASSVVVGDNSVLTFQSGLPQTVDSRGGAVSSADGKVTLQIPPGALSQPTTISIERDPIEGTVPYAGFIPGTVYRFQPSGLTFVVPANVTITYDATNVPTGIDPSSLIILWANQGREVVGVLEPWEERPSSADVTNSRVTGKIDHFTDGGVGMPVTSMLANPWTAIFQSASPPSVALIPNTEVPIELQLKAADNSPVIHDVDWTSANPTIATAATSGYNQGDIRAQNVPSGATTVTATVRNGMGPDVSVTIPVTIGIPTLTIATPTSGATFADLIDPETVALSHSQPEDLSTINQDDEEGTMTFSAFTYPGQEVTVFNWPFYGMSDDDEGGATSGSWPFAVEPIFSSMPVAMGQTNSLHYLQETGHVVRYVHGSCSVKFPWTVLFSLIEQSLNSVQICTLDKCPPVDGLVAIDFVEDMFEAQPHFRGQLFRTSSDLADLEMGFYFDARYIFDGPLGANKHIEMNPGYSIGRTADGLISAAMIHDQENSANVSVDNDTDPPTIAPQIRNQLRFQAPQQMSDAINNLLFQPIPAVFQVDTVCDPSQLDASSVCLGTVKGKLDDMCIGSCSNNGTPPPCKGQPSQDTCTAIAGCTWRSKVSSATDGTLPDACIPTCNLQPSEEKCTENASCTWTKGTIPEACIAQGLITQTNVGCVKNAGGTGSCMFRPSIQQVNVLPDALELVLAPNPARPFDQFDRVFRFLDQFLGGSSGVCGAPVTTNRALQRVTAMQCSQGTCGPAANPLGALLPLCGNGVLDPGEVCDDGNANACGTCSADCLSVNTMVQGCQSGFGCAQAADCANNNCFGGFCQLGTNCSQYNINCDYKAACGNRLLDLDTEVCDDGNTLDCGTCSADCKTINTTVVGCVAGIACMQHADCASANCAGGFCQP